MVDNSLYSTRTPRSAEPLDLYRRVGKRAVDVAIVLMVLPIAALVVALLMLVVASDGSNPLYSQKRLGRGGREFRFWKLRTMVPDADAVLASYIKASPHAAEEWAQRQKLREDPRITPVGRFLRATSLDELPQLINVLAGDMSLVGPRPMLPKQRALYPSQSYFELQPGITGLWQVSARNDTRFATRAAFDEAYNAQVSLGLDLRILARTVSVVVRRTGM